MAKSLLNVVSADQVPVVTRRIEAAIAKSFASDHFSPTGDEVRRRFAICERLICRLRADLGWGLQRALDHLPQYLRCELDGVPWEPDQRTIWVPEDGA
jgi:hypothetical protein